MRYEAQWWWAVVANQRSYIAKWRGEDRARKTLAFATVVCNEFEHINAMKTDPLAKS